MNACCYSFLYLRVLFLSKAQVELIKVYIILVLNVLILIKLMEAREVKNGLAPNFDFLIADHHLIKLKYWLFVLHMKIKWLKLKNNFTKYFCQSQLNFFIISFSSFHHLLHEFIFNVFRRQKIQIISEDLQSFNSNEGLFIVKKL